MDSCGLDILVSSVSRGRRWDVVECPGRLENTRDPGESHNRSQITYTLKIRRKTLFYTVNLIIPCTHARVSQKPYHPVRSHLAAQRQRLLPADRRRREDDHVHSFRRRPHDLR